MLVYSILKNCVNIIFVFLRFSISCFFTIFSFETLLLVFFMILLFVCFLWYFILNSNEALLCISETLTIQSNIEYLKESVLDLEKRIELLHGIVRTPSKVLNEAIFLKEGNPITCIQGNPITCIQGNPITCIQGNPITCIQGKYIEKIKDSMNAWIAWITPILLPSAKFIFDTITDFIKYLCKVSFDSLFKSTSKNGEISKIIIPSPEESTIDFFLIFKSIVLAASSYCFFLFMKNQKKILAHMNKIENLVEKNQTQMKDFEEILKKSGDRFDDTSVFLFRSTLEKKKNIQNSVDKILHEIKNLNEKVHSLLPFLSPVAKIGTLITGVHISNILNTSEDSSFVDSESESESKKEKNSSNKANTNYNYRFHLKKEDWPKLIYIFEGQDLFEDIVYSSSLKKESYFENETKILSGINTVLQSKKESFFENEILPQQSTKSNLLFMEKASQTEENVIDEKIKESSVFKLFQIISIGTVIVGAFFVLLSSTK